MAAPAIPDSSFELFFLAFLVALLCLLSGLLGCGSAAAWFWWRREAAGQTNAKKLAPEIYISRSGEAWHVDNQCWHIRNLTGVARKAPCDDCVKKYM
jgi:hypothetical protein